MVEQLRTFRNLESSFTIGQRFESVSPNGKYIRTLIYTGFIAPRQEPLALIQTFVNDINTFSGTDKLICLGAKVVSLLQGRYIRETDIRSTIASFCLSRFASKNGHNRGVAGNPLKLQAAIQEVGLPRVLIAASASAIEKLALMSKLLSQKRGVFYQILGDRVRAIDGLVPDGGYEHHIILAPQGVRQFCQQIENATSFPSAIVDINDLGGNILGKSQGAKLTDSELLEALCDNPFGQNKRRTPLAIVGRFNP